ncbi:hypothetical protein GYH30_052407 [Glycine max]|nr:hypothetical protein GYH30_052407 [Glycine max]
MDEYLSLVLQVAISKCYHDTSKVTDELVQIILGPGLEPGAAEVFLEFICYSGGPLPEELVPQVKCPILIAWGDKDPWEPIDNGRNYESFDSVEDFIVLPNVGHCPQFSSTCESEQMLKRGTPNVKTKGRTSIDKWQRRTPQRRTPQCGCSHENAEIVVKLGNTIEDIVFHKMYHIRGENITRADLLSKLASTKKAGHLKTIIQETLQAPTIDTKETNGQAEVANRVILKPLHARLDKSKALWKEELPNIL